MRLFSYSFILASSLILISNVLLQPSFGQQGEIVNYVVDDTWPRKPERFKWAQMAGIAVDNQDQIYRKTRCLFQPVTGFARFPLQWREPTRDNKHSK